jgi:hypothetical protein
MGGTVGETMKTSTLIRGSVFQGLALTGMVIAAGGLFSAWILPMCGTDVDGRMILETGSIQSLIWIIIFVAFWALRARLRRTDRPDATVK